MNLVSDQSPPPEGEEVDVPDPADVQPSTSRHPRQRAAIGLGLSLAGLTTAVAAATATVSGDAFLKTVVELLPAALTAAATGIVAAAISEIAKRIRNAERLTFPITLGAIEQTSQLQIHVWRDQQSIREAIQAGRRDG